MPHPDMVPLIITDDLPTTRAFYVDELGCAVTVEQDNYLQVRFGESDGAPELAFLPPQPADSPLGRQDPFAGGLVVSIAVHDADKHRSWLTERGVDAPEATDKPWGWRSLVLRDPNGVTLDFFHEIADTAAQDASS